MRNILGFTRDTAVVTMRYLLDIPTIKFRWRICQASACLLISMNKEHPLHNELRKTKSTRLKRRKSWLAQAVDVNLHVCDFEGIKYNDRADSLAKSAPMVNRIAMDHTK